MTNDTPWLYDPSASGVMPPEEARHALRVLRLAPGDAITVTDGKGTLLSAVISQADKAGRCCYEVTEQTTQPPLWQGRIHIAVAPVKSPERTDWLVEKATEIGFDEITFLRCRRSERKAVNTGRLLRIAASAMKQSHKARLPRISPLTDFSEFVTAQREGHKLICHCLTAERKPFLLDALTTPCHATVLIGPEGDFSPEEIQLALSHGWLATSLGESRLRGETAALVAVHLMNLKASRSSL